MNEIADYLETVKKTKGIKNDRQLAFRLGITPGFISLIHSGKKMVSDELCVKIAKLAGDDPEKIILLAHRNKASEETKPYWEHIAKTLAAATLAVYITLPFTSKLLDTRYIM